MSKIAVQATMPSKRKRSLAFDGKEEREESPAPPSKRKKKSLQYDPQELCQELLNTIRNYKAEDGRLICESFIRVPKRRTAADYYEVVTTPIDLLKIQQKLKMEEYEDIDQLTADVELMLNNAKAYYKKTSQEYKDACELWELFMETKNDMISEAFGESSRPDRRRSRRADPETEDVESENGDQEKTHEEEDDDEDDESEYERDMAPVTQSEPDDPDDLEQLFASVVTARDGDRDVSLMFQLLPSRSKYPEYYELIKNPIDLKTIAQRIQDLTYKYVWQLEKDLMLMIKNAKTFNEPRSQIYKDAVLLKKAIAAKRNEIEYKKQGLLKSSERIRTRERTNVQRMSAVCAALKYQSDDESEVAGSQAGSHMEYEAESEGETNTSEEETPQWMLYQAVKNFKSPAGEQLSEPFLKLPNKRYYPDYYDEIKNPISIFNIRKKLKHNHYSSLTSLVTDMNRVFDNAKQYNQDESKLYRDAVMLQKYMMEKKKEMERFEMKEMTMDEISPIFDSPVVKLERDIVEEEHTPKGKSRRSVVPDSEKKKSAKKSPEEGLKKRMWTLYKSVFDYTDNTSRPLREIFMILPSRKDYPDYYQVIMEPIDMTMIETKIKTDKYATELALMNDFDLMFNNARHYNEESSLVYQDANTLDRVLKSKWRTITQSLAAARTGQSKTRPKSKSSSPLSQKLQDLYETIRDHQDKAGRVLSSPFLKLPLKSDYPDYYEVIKRPVDMQRIQQRMASNQYENVEDMVADFVQMFDNACKYNEPDSLIYKDALTLQRICLEKKKELTSDGTNDVPDVRALVQELMTNLFISVYNYQDEEGRCYSDSFAELVDKESGQEGEPQTVKPPTFDQIRRNLDKGRYRRVDRFQEDMFKVFENARRLSRTDSQLYEDAIEMQMFFLKIRDELCKNGEMLLTPALSYTERHLQVALENEKKEKLPLELKEDEEKKKLQDSEEKLEETPAEGEPSEDSVKIKDQVYYVGDYVYVEPREPTLLPHIMLIEKFITDLSGSQLMQGNWFYRPNETFHLATRKFLEKEVFKSDIVTGIALTQIIGRCHVMFVKDYFKMRPEGIPDKDVYVCESRYNARHKAFKKIKIWQVPKNDQLKIVPRETSVSAVRVASMFADKSPTEGKDEDDGQTSILDKQRINVLAEGNSEDGNTYYEQFMTNAGCFKLGDSVYVRSDRDRPLIARIDKIWTTPAGDAYFFGPWFVRPSEIEHSPTRLFYKREVFLSSIEDTNPLQSIIGKCSVLHIKDYCSCRPTERAEYDVYICESKYHEGEKSIKKLGKGLKKYSLSPKVTDDEIYFFRKHISPQKEPSPLLLKVSVEHYSVESEETQEAEVELVTETVNVSLEEVPPPPEKSTKKSSKPKSNVRRQPSGYIVFAGEIRKQIQQENPECSFGDISRIVGTKWRNLVKEDKERFEEKAKKIAEEQAAKQQEAEKAFNESLNRSQSPWDYGRMSPVSSGRPHTPGSYPQGYPQGQFVGYQAFPGQPGMQQGNYGMQNGTMTPQQGMPYGLPMQQLSRGPPGMPLTPGQRQYMPPYQQHPNNRLQGPYPGIPQGQTPPRATQSPHLGMPLAGMQSPHPPMSPGPYPMMPPSPHSNMSMAATPQGMMMPPQPATTIESQPCMPQVRLCAPLPSGVGNPQYSLSTGFTPASNYFSQPFYHPQFDNLDSGQSQHMVPPPPPPRPPSPVFVSVPPKTQRLLHSEAYLRYIEGLNAENRTISDWDKSLSATPENTPPVSESRLPTQWLAQGAGYHGNVTNALWALRDHMLKDTLSITRTISFDDL